MRGRPTVSVDVLVVDDDADVRRSMAEVLRGAGYAVHVAENGLAALAALGTTTVRVVVLDLKMPLLDGIGFLERAEALPPVVVVSAHALDDLKKRVGADVVGYLQKPVPPARLLQAVEWALRRHPS